MTPPGKIIDIDAFKKKDESFSASKSGSFRKNGAPEEKGSIFNGADKHTVILLLILALFFAMLMTPERRSEIAIYPVDSIAPRNVKAPNDSLIEDVVSTEKNRNMAREVILDVYDLDDTSIDGATKKIREAFTQIAASYATHSEHAYLIALKGFGSAGKEKTSEENVAKTSLRKFETSEGFSDLEKRFVKTAGVEIADRDLKTLRYYHYWPKIADDILSAMTDVKKFGVLHAKSDLPTSSLKGIFLRALSNSQEKRIDNFEAVLDVAEAKKLVEEKVDRIIVPSRKSLRRASKNIANSLITPNISFNRQETEKRKQEASIAVNPVFFQVKRGEMIIREGDRVTPADAVKLASLSRSEKASKTPVIFIGLFFVNLTILILGAYVVKKFHEEITQNKTLQQLVALLLSGHIFAVWAVTKLGSAILPVSPDLGVDTYTLAAPLVAGPMLVSIFFTVEFTVLFTLFAATLTGLLLRDFSLVPLLTVMSGMICAHQVGSYQKRSSVVLVGLMVVAVTALTILAYDTITTKFLSGVQFYDVVFVFLGAGIAVALVSTVMPVIEHFYPVVSDIKLVEISNPDHPLLRRMLMEAPGTYHHSMMVGYLAEEAAKAIEANALLARAGSMFHDIGKIKKPEYYIENQARGDNPHERLTPRMSALVITNHIKEGLEMAKQYKLLPQITAMIPEHHGTGLVRYFYHKAKEQEEDITRSEVKEEDYRYPGPAPSSKESACVALADSVEAAARACNEPTPLRLKGIVTDVINDKFVQGQLDNSHLTLHDLANITDSFVHVLTAIHHHRIQYPDAKADKEQKADNGQNIKKREGPEESGASST